MSEKGTQVYSKPQSFFCTDTSGIKHDMGKTRYDLFPFDALHEMALVMTGGAEKYDDRNWEKGMKYGRLIGAALRHISSFMRGQIINTEDFGCHHLAHAAVCIMMVLAYELRGMRSKLNDLQGEIEE